MSTPKCKTSIAVITVLTILVGLLIFNLQPSNSMQHTRNRYRFQASEIDLLNQVEREGIQYFLDNQLDNGMILDRQANQSKDKHKAAISTSATGMGLIAIAIGSSPELNMLSRQDAIARVRKTLEVSLTLKNDHGMMPHFLDPATLTSDSIDDISTIDSGWLIAGGLWAAEFLDDDGLRSLATQLEERVDWSYWGEQRADGIQIVMGVDRGGKKLPAWYDRYNQEAAVLYMLAIGSNNGTAIPAENWYKLSANSSTVAGLKISGWDLGLFAFQYGGALIDFSSLPLNGMPDLQREAQKEAVANYAVCQTARSKYRTYERFWGLSAGDGPPEKPGDNDPYNIYTTQEYDGTAHITASIASIEHVPELVIANMLAAEAEPNLKAHGLYGYSNINVDQNWVSRDVVGIDIGAAVMALENELRGGRLRRTWSRLPLMRRAKRRLRAAAESQKRGKAESKQPVCQKQHQRRQKPRQSQRRRHQAARLTSASKPNK